MHIVTTHKNTDFDALASVIAATRFYPGAIGVIPSSTNRNVEQFLSTHKSAFQLIQPKEVDFSAVTRLTIVDTNQWYRLDRMEQLRSREDLHINLWDHHLTTKGDITGSFECCQQIGATISLLLREMPADVVASLSPLETTIFLLGLYEDTGHLSFPSTTAEDARAAALLLDHGADLNVARFFLNPPYEERQKDVLFLMIQATRRTTIHGFAIGFHHLRLESKVPELASVLSLCRQLTGVDAIFGIYDLGDRHTIIGRSALPEINVGNLLGEFGGGGHQGAGSASVKNNSATPEQSEQRLETLLHTTKSRELRIAAIMSSPVISVAPETPVQEVKELMEEKEIRSLVVLDEESIAGMFVLSDLKRVKKEKQWQAPVKAFMTRNIITITPSATPREAAKVISEHDIGYLPVVEDGRLRGILSRTDLLAWFYRMKPGFS